MSVINPIQNGNGADLQGKSLWRAVTGDNNLFTGFVNIKSMENSSCVLFPPETEYHQPTRSTVRYFPKLAVLFLMALINRW